jgi:hypothetical protein
MTTNIVNSNNMQAIPNQLMRIEGVESAKAEAEEPAFSWSSSAVPAGSAVDEPAPNRKLLQHVINQSCCAPPCQMENPFTAFTGPLSVTVINEDGTIGHGDPADYPDLFPGAQPDCDFECFAGPLSVTVINEDGTIGHGDPADYPDIFC